MSSAVTTQNSTGEARGKFDRVSFNLQVEGRDTTGPKAKTRAQKIIVEQVEAALEGLKKEGITFNKDDQEATFEVRQNTVYDQESGSHRPSGGFSAVYSIHLETNQVEKTSKIQDVLTSIEGITIGSPVFSMNPETRRKLQKTALKEAVKVAWERFKEECEVLGLKSDDFAFDTWQVSYSDHRPSSYSNSMAFEAVAACSDASGGNAPVEIQSRLASIKVSLELTFKRK